MLYLKKNDPLPLRKKLQVALGNAGLIEEIHFDSDSVIEVIGGRDTGKLQKVFIIDLNLLSSTAVTHLWRVNLEKSIPGISAGSKTTEVALIVLQEIDGIAVLNIILIELKNSLQSEIKNNKLKNTFEDIEGKLIETINRMYLLLAINNHHAHKDYEGKKIVVNFRGVICYNDEAIKLANLSSLYQLFTKAKAKTEAEKTGRNKVTNLPVSVWNCETICGLQEVTVKFFKNPNPLISDDKRESFDIRSDQLFWWLFPVQ